MSSAKSSTMQERVGMSDSDPLETREWLESLETLVSCGEARGLFMLKQLEAHPQQLGLVSQVPPYSAYRNTIPLEKQIRHPGDVEMEERITGGEDTKRNNTHAKACYFAERGVANAA